jgi:Virulence factor BrkB
VPCHQVLNRRAATTIRLGLVLRAGFFLNNAPQLPCPSVGFEKYSLGAHAAQRPAVQTVAEAGSGGEEESDAGVVPGGGALVTAALFEIGKVLIGLYIKKQALESAYGAASSIVVVLIWVYYNARSFSWGPNSRASMPSTTGSRESSREAGTIK